MLLVLLKSKLTVVREEIVEVDPAVDCSSHNGVKLGSLEVCSDNFVKFAVTQNLNNRRDYPTCFYKNSALPGFLVLNKKSSEHR